jgi:hypothetical protein
MMWDDRTSAPSTVDAETQTDMPSPLKFERRTQDRWPMSIAATIFELGGASFGHMHQISVRDCSDGGLGAISDTPIAPGSVVSIGFSSPGMYAKRGTVLSCTPCGDGYRISVQFEARMAA